jgi:CspA family cold shock protein
MKNAGVPFTPLRTPPRKSAFTLGAYFPAQDRGGKDVFVHATTLGRSGLNELAEGQRVRLQISQGQKGLEARSIELLD